MNERIGKLISEAIKAIPDHVDFDLPREFTEKFAELIVRECAQQAHDLADMLAMHRDKSGAEIAESVGNTIKEHFGVKE
jgi:hypothetical protein